MPMVQKFNVKMMPKYICNLVGDKQWTQVVNIDHCRSNNGRWILGVEMKVVKDIHAQRYKGLMSKSLDGSQQRRKSRVIDSMVAETRVMHGVQDHHLGLVKRCPQMATKMLRHRGWQRFEFQ
jgi:hypothetical protein